jgi:thiol reductant ABC exporter CydD subunit
LAPPERSESLSTRIRPAAAESAPATSGLDRRLLAQAPSSRRWLVAAVGLGTLAGLAAIGQAREVSRAIEAVFLFARPPSSIASTLLLLIAWTALRGGLSWGSDVASQRAATRVKHALRLRLFTGLLDRRPPSQDHDHTGVLTQVVGAGIESLDGYVGQFLPQRILAVAVPLTILLAIARLDLLSASILLLTGPLIPLFLWLVGGAAARQTRLQWQTLGRLSATFVDVMAGMATIKAFASQRVARDRVWDGTEGFRHATMSVLRLAFLSSFSLELLAMLSTALIAVQVGLRLLYGHIDFGVAMFVLVLAPEFYLPLRHLGTRFHFGASGQEAARQIFTLIDQASPPEQPGRRRPPAQAPLTLRFEDVSVTYSNDRPPALDRLHLDLAAGGRLGVLGPSGAGKSTLALVLLRIVEPSGGRVLVNGQPLEEMDAAQWRSAISWVPQEPQILDGTVAENLRLANPLAGEPDLRSASVRAGFDEVLSLLADGFETRLGAGGVQLSSGERKRLGLARAFLRSAPLWILDEPTAHLDPALEDRVRQSLDELPEDRTVVTIAQRLAGLPSCDQVVILADGRLAEQGRPADLRHQDSIYRQLVAAYASP